MKFLAFITFALTLTANAASFKLSPDKSKLEWEGKKVSGSHHGTVDLKSGSVNYDKGALTGGAIVVNLETLKINDLEGEWAEKLGGHLRSDDFFSVAKYPEVTFKIDKVKKLGDNKYEVSGPLTIKGKSAPQTFTVTVKQTKKGLSVIGDISIDRTIYNIRYGSGKFFDPKTLGDKMIDDKFNLKLNLVAQE